MEFHVKLQELRKRNGLTQEALAEQLFVSRTAVSKWESGRGFPNIDSLKAIAACFSVSVDELLSSEELLAIAESDRKDREATLRDLLFGLLDCGLSLLLFLPLFRCLSDGVVQAVSLPGLQGVPPYLKAAFWAVVVASVLFGVLTLALQNYRRRWWMQSKTAVSLLIGTAAAGLFIAGGHPYAAIFALTFLFIKGAFLLKRR